MVSFAHLGRALRVLRERQGTRQYEVANSAGITKAMLSAYEVGKQQPSLTSLERILDALGSSLSELARELEVLQERRSKTDGSAVRSQTPTRRPLPNAVEGTDLEGADLPPLNASVNRMLLALFETRLDEVREILRKELGTER